MKTTEQKRYDVVMNTKHFVVIAGDMNEAIAIAAHDFGEPYDQLTITEARQPVVIEELPVEAASYARALREVLEIIRMCKSATLGVGSAAFVALDHVKEAVERIVPMGHPNEYVATYYAELRNGAIEEVCSLLSNMSPPIETPERDFLIKEIRTIKGDKP